MSLHTFPAFLPDDAGADEHIIFERNPCANRADGVLEAPIVFVYNDEDIDIRPRLAVATGL